MPPVRSSAFSLSFQRASQLVDDFVGVQLVVELVVDFVVVQLVVELVVDFVVSLYLLFFIVKCSKLIRFP